jgi:hypothetical protein
MKKRKNENPEIDTKFVYKTNYVVPVVTKNRDFLQGALMFRMMMMPALVPVFDELELTFASIFPNNAFDLMDSTRFNDTIKEGVTVTSLTKKEMQGFLDDRLKEHSKRITMMEQKYGDTDILKLNEVVLAINCSCGNFISFKNLEDLPEKHLRCQLCDKLLIDYTDKDDTDFYYSGTFLNDKLEEEEDVGPAGDEDDFNNLI